MSDSLIKLTLLARDEESARSIAMKEHNVSAIINVKEINRIFEIIAVEHRESIKGTIKFTVEKEIEECRCLYFLDKENLILDIELLNPILGLVDYLEKIYKTHQGDDFRWDALPVKINFELIDNENIILCRGGIINWFEKNELKITLDNFVKL